MPKLDLPPLPFPYREMTSLECLDVSGRIVRELGDLKTGLLPQDWLNREIDAAAARCVAELSERMRLERSSRFTKEKQRVHGDRRRYLVELRAGARQWVRNPDPEIPQEKRHAGATVLAVFKKHQSALRSKGQIDTTGVVRLILEDLSGDDYQTALREANLLRLHAGLAAAQDRYQDLTRQEEREEAQAKNKVSPDASEETASSAPANAPPRLTGEIKKELAGHLELLFRNMLFLANTGRKQYAVLLTQCGQMIADVHSLTKFRETWERKAAERKARTEESLATRNDLASPVAHLPSPAPAPSQPPSPASAPAATAAREGLDG